MSSGSVDLGSTFGSGGGGVTSLNTLTGDLTLVAGSGITITPSTPNITIAATALSVGNLTDVGTDGITITGGTGAVVGSGTSLSQHVADTTHNGYLSSTDWNTFNGKQASLTFGNLTDVGTDGITVTGGTGSVIGSGTSISQHVADATHSGYLSTTDWNTFNGKQAAGNYITALTGDVTASGPGSVASSLVATTNSTLTTLSALSLPIGQLTGVLPIANGGTNLSTYTTGDTLYSSATNVLSKLAVGTSGSVLTVSSGLPAYSSATAKIIYVSQDVGNDSFSGTMALPFKTIQAAINAANAIAAYYNQVIVEVNPSSTSSGYNENITLSQQGVVLQASSSLYRSDAVLIKGSVTINLTGVSGGGNFVAASNIVYIHGFTIVNSSGDCIIFSGSTFQRLFITDCYVQSTASGSALNMTNTGVNAGVKSTITSRDTDYENNSSSIATIILAAGRIFISGSSVTIQNDNAAGPSLNVSGASAAGPTISLNNPQLVGQVLVSDNTANVTISNYTLSSGSLPAIVTPSSPNTGVITIGTGAITTTATNSITGSGILVPGGENAKASTGGDIISTVTQVTLAKFPEGQTLLGAGATAVTNSLLIVKDGHLTSQQTTAPTSALQTGAGSTASRTLTRCTDVAGHISITPGGTGIAAGAQLIVTFNKAYSNAPVVSLTATNASASTLQLYASSSTTTFTVNCNVAGTTGVAFTFDYHIIET